MAQNSFLRIALLPAVAFFVTAIPVFAQSAELAGRVCDPSNAVIAGAEVVATNTATGVSRHTVTAGRGAVCASRFRATAWKCR
jgi:carboxypeptidase family protein